MVAVELEHTNTDTNPSRLWKNGSGGLVRRTNRDPEGAISPVHRPLLYPLAIFREVETQAQLLPQVGLEQAGWQAPKLLSSARTASNSIAVLSAFQQTDDQSQLRSNRQAHKRAGRALLSSRAASLQTCLSDYLVNLECSALRPCSCAQSSRPPPSPRQEDPPRRASRIDCAGPVPEESALPSRAADNA